jgi:DNA-binding SARP family transcriptional activator/predicted ATPase/Tfp pilus assembly protein PilF
LNSQLELILLGRPALTFGSTPITVEKVSAKGLALLIYLAFTGQRHSRSALAGLLWGDLPEESARANLRLALTKLRKIVPDYLETSRLEVVFAAGQPHRLDVAEFEQLTQAGPTSENLAAAAQLYRGPFLEGFIVPKAPEFDFWVETQRERLHQLAVKNLLMGIRLATQARRLDDCLAAARQLLQVEPWHEEGHRTVMRLLAASGQRSMALAQYETCRRLLADEIGIEPAAETVTLYEEIVNDRVTRWDDSELMASALPVIAPASAPVPLNNLPAQFTPFIGREAELKRLTERLLHPDYRLLTLLGEGGVGKTRLALAAAERVKGEFADGVWFVPLIGLEKAGDGPEPDDQENRVATAVAAAMRLTFFSSEPPKKQIGNYLRGKQCLLVLDNFEPLLAAAGFVLELLSAAPRLTILTTSREPLHLQAEAIVRVEGLALPETADDPQAARADGIRLFAERAERTTGWEVVTPAALPDVVGLCRFVNGLPLGIEIMASWTRWLSLPAIRQGLEENAVRLETSLRDVTPRHRSLQAVFDYSWELLSHDEQELLAQLSVFRHGFRLKAVREVVGAGPTTLFALVDKSLVQHGEDGYYGLHDLLRQYAAARLSDLALDRMALYGRHASYYLALAGRQADALVGPEPHLALRRLQADSENLAQAWRQAAEQRLLAALADGTESMTRYWDYAGLYTEGEQALAAAIAAVQPLADPADPRPDLCRLLARMAADRASLLFDLNRLAEVESEAQACLYWAELVDDGALIAHGHLCLGQVFWRRGEYEATGEQFQEAQALAAEMQQTVLEAVIWRNLAAVAWRLGDAKMAEEACGRSLRLHQQAADVRGENRTRHLLGILALNRHDYEAVREHLGMALTAAHEMGDRTIEYGAYAVLGQVACYQGRYEEALTYYSHERELAEELNVPWQMGSNASNTGDTLLRLGDYAGALASYERALAIFRQIEALDAESNILSFMGLLACLQGRFADGRSMCEQALVLAQQADARREQAFARLFLAHNLAGLERWVEARQAYSQAQAAWQALGEEIRRVEAQAGVARTAWHLADMTGAAGVVNEILTYLQGHTADGADDPVLIYLTCYDILKQMADERAAGVLADGRAFLQSRAARIQDPVRRQAFLDDIPSHKALLSR